MSNDFSLTPSPNRKPMDPNRRANDSAALAGLLHLVNNPELEMLNKISPDVVPGAEKIAIVTAEQEAPRLAAAVAPKPAPIAPSHSPRLLTPAPAAVVLKRPVGRAILFSGRLSSGKDYVAERAEATIFGFADPMYQVATYFFGVEVTATKNKDLPGMRAFLQYLGQWGRGEVTEKYPYTPARAAFTQMIRSLGSAGLLPAGVEWMNFGLDKDIWVKSCHTRTDLFRAENPAKRVAITNARFENELTFFREREWDHWHVMCSPETWAERLTKKGLTPQSKELADLSEQLAAHLDRDVYKKIKEKPVGDKLRVIWNDHRPAPSNRLFGINEFIQTLVIADLPDLGDQV